MAANPIDDSLYSRQRYMLGDTAMQRMASSSVLLLGLGGVGVEIAKNLVLAGVKSLMLCDPAEVTANDLGSQFFLRQTDIGLSRAEASLAKLQELNPYVAVSVATSWDQTNMSFLNDFQCMIVTQLNMAQKIQLNNYCRQHDPPIKFLTADVYGVFCWAFCDFGSDFEVIDSNGEEPREVFISNISKGDPGIVTTLDQRMHGLESGDSVTFREVKGMTEVNDQIFKVTVLSRCTFSIGDTSAFSPFITGGLLKQVKLPQIIHFESLPHQLKSPSFLLPDLAKLEAPLDIHVGLLTLEMYREKHGRLPNPWCSDDADQFLDLASYANKELDSPLEKLDEAMLRHLAMTCQGCLPPLCAFLGGVIAQESIKAVTGKYTPLKQWLHFDAREVLPTGRVTASKVSGSSRYNGLRICLGDEVCTKLAQLKLFMVGCGAIGCEMLKNYALLGIATQGKLTITDNDLIEKSNLNRQFLFRPQHIRKPKSTTAAQSVVEINPDLKIEAQQYKVCPQTEQEVYTDAFFESLDIVVNALDNIEARRYMDSRCVTNCRPLLESGTMGPKGHVQVIAPHLTESYGSQMDPPEESVPYCTLKSFPAVIDHCIQWARDKFESSFTQKPSACVKFWSAHPSVLDVVQRLDRSEYLDGCVQVSKLESERPLVWADCVKLARCKFEKYFSNKAKQLLHAFPVDSKLKDGSLFWSSPKRPPVPVVFVSDHPTHVKFLEVTARLYAKVHGISWNIEDLETETLLSHLHNVRVPQFSPTTKKIEIEATASKPDQSDDAPPHELPEMAGKLRLALEREQELRPWSALQFEKDDDANGHIDFITAASNLRAAMYGIEPADRLRTKLIAGRIVPAIATTTAAVAGLVSIELIKLVQKRKVEDLKNCFLNLALPSILCCQPGVAPVTSLTNGQSFTLWDRWEVHGRPDMTLQQFINFIKSERGLDVSLVVQGVKMVYVPIMPGHSKRLSQPMLKLLRRPGDRAYTDLVVSYTCALDDDQMGPPVRYFFN